jgi:hypothetical protein
VSKQKDGVHVTLAEGVRAIELDLGALGTSIEHPPPLILDRNGFVETVSVGWAKRTP